MLTNAWVLAAVVALLLGTGLWPADSVGQAPDNRAERLARRRTTSLCRTWRPSRSSTTCITSAWDMSGPG